MAVRSKKNNIHKVAEKAGTSVMTVTRAFNNTGRIAAGTRDRILKVAKELGYKPDFFARGMRGSSTMSVGVLVSMGCKQPINSKIRAITSQLYDAGYIAYVADSFSDIKIIIKLLEEFLARKVDALFLQVGFKYILEDKRIKELLKQFPAVLIESFWRSNSPHDQLILDRHDTIRDVARRFLKSGRKRPVIIAMDAAKMVEIFKEVMLGNGCDLPEKILIKLDESTANLYHGKVYWDALRNNYPDLKGFDGVWCVTDEGAAAVISGLSDAGIKVPDEVAVIGYQNSEICSYTRPTLASVDIHDEQASEMAAWMLNDRLKNPDKPPMTELINMTFVPRESFPVEQ